MAGFLSNVFGGDTGSSSTTSTNLPDWFNSYGQDLFTAGRNNFLNSTYPGAYTGQRVAGSNADLDASHAGVRDMQGDYGPAMDQSQGAIGTGLGYVGTGAGMIGTGAGTIGQGTGMVTAGQGMVGQGAGLVGQAGQQFNQGDFSQFMSPYTEGVVNRIAQLGQRNLSENLLPSLNANFISSGNFGSSQNSDFTQRAVRDTNESIMGEQAKALESGFGTSMGAYQNAQNRQLAAGQAMGTLGAQSGQLGATMGTLGTQQGALGAQMGVLGTEAGQLGQAGGALAKTRQDMQLRDAAALEQVGLDTRNQQQKQDDVNYGNFTEGRDWGRQMTQGASGIAQGYTPPSTTTTNTTANSGTNLGGLGQLLGGAAAVASVIPWGKRRGGRIRKRQGGVLRRLHGS